MPLGTIVNAVAVIAGSLVGMLLRRGVPERLRGIIFEGIGLVTLVIGMLNALEIDSPSHLMTVIFSVLIGGLLGEWARLEERLEHLGDWLKAKAKSRDARFTEGLVTAFLIFCIGPMTLMGALDEGLSGDASLLYAKSILDLFMSMALASTFGLGVLFSFIPLLIFQAGITLLGLGVGNVVSEVMISQLTAVGGVLILGLGISILGLKKLRVANLLPALVVIVVLTLIFG